MSHDHNHGAPAASFGVHHATLEVECVGRECADGCCVYAPTQVTEQPI